MERAFLTYVLVLLRLNIFLALSSFSCAQSIPYIKDSLISEIDYIRANPSEYGQRIHISLDDFEPKKELKRTLFMDLIAQERASECAKMRSLSHSNRDKKDFRGKEYSESLHKSRYWEFIIQELIADYGVSSKSHRKHVFTDHKRIGIGVSKRDGVYYVAIITKP